MQLNEEKKMKLESGPSILVLDRRATLQPQLSFLTLISFFRKHIVFSVRNMQKGLVGKYVLERNQVGICI